MRQELYCRSLVIVSALAASLASAQTTSQDSGSRIKVEEDAPAPRNRFGLNYRMGFNISARFKNLGGYPVLSNPGLTPNGAPWNYDNGYNLNDAPGTPPGQTWYWGYVDPAQVHDGSLYLSRSSAAGDVSSGGKKDDPQPGFELTYNRELGQIGKAHWGLEGALNFMQVTIHDDRTLFGNVTTQTDAYALNGVIPPAPPYFGTYEGPVPGGPNRPVISDRPIAQAPVTIPNGVTIAGQRKFQADVYGFRAGPYLEIPLSRKLAFSLSGGVALASVNGEYKFNEVVTIPSTGTVARSGTGAHSDLLVGGYAGVTVSYSFSRAWSASVGAQYQNLGRFSQQVGAKQADLDLRNSIFVTLGIGYSF